MQRLQKVRLPLVLLAAMCACAAQTARTPPTHGHRRLAPAAARDAPHVAPAIGAASAQATLKSRSGSWNGIPLPSGTVVLVGSVDAAGNFVQRGTDVVCAATGPTPWCKKYAEGDEIMISETRLNVSYGSVRGSLRFWLGPFSAIIRLEGRLLGGVYDVAQEGRPVWNMQLGRSRE